MTAEDPDHNFKIKFEYYIVWNYTLFKILVGVRMELELWF